MICPDCHQSFDQADGFCPRCGERKGIVRTSTILISVGESEGVYRSVEDVPDPLRGQLLRSTRGVNSATIVIADSEGRKEIAKAIRNLPGSPEAAKVEAPKPAWHRVIRRAAGAVGLLIAAALVWIIFHPAG